MGNVIISPKGALNWQLEEQIGSILIGMGKLTSDQLLQVIEYQARYECNFGQASIRLGYLHQADVDLALAKQSKDSAPPIEMELSRSEELVIASQPFSAEAEVFRALRSQLMMRCFEKGRRALAVVSPNSGSGCTYVAVNIAIVIAQLGVGVCLVDSNLRNPRIHEIFGIPESQKGLSDVLREKASHDQIMVKEKFPGLSILVAGRIPPNPQELLSGGAFVRLISQILREYAVVIFDTPASNIYADHRTIAGRIGSAIMVTRKHHTPAHDAEILAEDFRSSGCELIGSILNAY